MIPGVRTWGCVVGLGAFAACGRVGFDPTPAAPDEVQDAFGGGWFNDDGAWLQIALWGAALILLAIACRKISRRFRHDSIGILAVSIPFVICLYFFYQNVNRLLPPGF